jgi:hypothetical protein
MNFNEACNRLGERIERLETANESLARQLHTQQDSVRQIAGIVRMVELNGHAMIPVRDMLSGTENFLRIVEGSYHTYLPAHSVNYVIARAGLDGNPNESCGVQTVGVHNRYRFGLNPSEVW